MNPIIKYGIFAAMVAVWLYGAIQKKRSGETVSDLERKLQLDDAHDKLFGETEDNKSQ